MQAELIDCHVHLVTGNPGYPKSLDVKTLLDLMAAAGVCRAVIVQSRSGNGLENDAPSRAARTDPSRLIAICGLDIEQQHAELALRHRCSRWAAKGARVFWGRRSLLDESLAAVWETAVEMAVPVLLAGPARFAEAGALCRRYSGLRVVLDHCGDPRELTVWPDDLLRLADEPGIFLKYSSHVHERIERQRQEPVRMLDRLIEVFGADRLLWGSNYPASHEPRWTYAGAVRAFTQAIALQPGDVQCALRGGTAMRLWPALAIARQP